jgi:hypothetical protein
MQPGLQRHEQLVQALGLPAGARFQLRADEDEGIGRALRHLLRRTVDLDLLQVGAPLARAMQEDHQRPARAALRVLARQPDPEAFALELPGPLLARGEAVGHRGR